MSPQSIGIAWTTASLVAVVLGRALRNRSSASSIAFAVSAAIGLAMISGTEPSDWMSAFRPTVALDWLPAIAMASLMVSLVTADRKTARVVLSSMVAIGITGRLLWGSVYLRDFSWNSLSSHPGTIVLIVGWSVALSAAFSRLAPAVRRRWDGNVVAWAIAVAGTAALVAMTGSITYAAALGTVGVSVLATLIVTGRLPVLAAIPVMVLVGLSVAYSELSVGVACLVQPAWIGLTWTSNRAPARPPEASPASTEPAVSDQPKKISPSGGRWGKPLARAASTGLVILALVVTVAGELAKEPDASAAYGQTPPTESRPPTPSAPPALPSPALAPPDLSPPGEPAVTEESIEVPQRKLPDPFGAFPAP